MTRFLAGLAAIALLAQLAGCSGGTGSTGGPSPSLEPAGSASTPASATAAPATPSPSAVTPSGGGLPSLAPGQLVPGRFGAITWGVPAADLPLVARLGITTVIKRIETPTDEEHYLDAAASVGLHVIVQFALGPGTAPGLDPGDVAGRVAGIRDHPALAGYLALVEPSATQMTVAQMQVVHDAYHAADPNHPVVVSITDLAKFGSPENPWAAGLADVVFVEWYPVREHGYSPDAEWLFPSVRSILARTGPGQVWLVAQCHGFPAGGKVAPTPADLDREVADGIRWLGVDGVVYYPWLVADYSSDLSRDPALQAEVARIVAKGPPTADAAGSSGFVVGGVG